MIKEKHDMSLDEMRAHISLNGDFNDYPPHWKEITATEFAKSRHFMFSPVLVEYRQMLARDGEGKVQRLESGVPAHAVGADLHWQRNGTGFAIVHDHWAGTVKFFKFGSVHEGYVEHFDSSD